MSKCALLAFWHTEISAHTLAFGAKSKQNMCNLRHYANCNFRKLQYNVPIVWCFPLNEILFTTLRLIITHHICHLHRQKSALFSRHTELLFLSFSLRNIYIYLNISTLTRPGDSAHDDPGLPEYCDSFVSLCKQQTPKRDPNGSRAHSQVTAAALSSCPENRSKFWLLLRHPPCFSWCFSCHFYSFTSAVVNVSTYFSVRVSSSLLRRWCDSAMSHESLCYHVLSCSSREDSACQKPLWFVPSHWCLSVCGLFLASN